MRALIEKEVRLVLHPSTYALAALGALALIPSWMYGAIFVYGVLVAFFNGMNAREMRDLEYTFSLPVSRRSMVRSRIAVMMAIEATILVVMTAFIASREPLGINGFAAEQGFIGVAANLYLVGFGFIVFGLFNAVFYPLYYRNPSKVGVPFLVASIPTTLAIVAMEALLYLPVAMFVPLGAPGFQDLPTQLAFSGIGIALFAASGAIAAKLAAKRFELFDS